MNLQSRLDRLERDYLPRRLAHLERVEALHAFLCRAAEIERKDSAERTAEEQKILRTATQIMAELTAERALAVLRHDAEQQEDAC